MTASQKTREMRQTRSHRIHCAGCGASCKDYADRRKHALEAHNEVIR